MQASENHRRVASFEYSLVEVLPDGDRVLRWEHLTKGEVADLYRALRATPTASNFVIQRQHPVREPFRVDRVEG